ncbi:hypothetical protein Patl1_17132 [Pistacia atlantica]|uniref:Uncharacterized protein n=1 Tax=Pistacia atlantica TaxID=434234 RepID=A0ACC1B5C6_9ROSI|nr:hypothetical protein Patl1_17132 [Pistacia atlantica]
MALFTSISSAPLSVSPPIHRRFTSIRRSLRPFASLSPSESSSSPTPSISSPATTASTNENVVSSKPPSSFNYALANPSGDPVVRFVRSTETNIERESKVIWKLGKITFGLKRYGIPTSKHGYKAIFDFRFLALLAVAGSLAGSVLCFLNGCLYIVEAYKVYWTSCVKGVHSGQMVLRLVEAIDVYLAGTVMLIFGMGLYGLFISNVPPDVAPSSDRALKGSSLFGMFSLKERPKWMKISSLDELKTKVGHVIVMILLVKMFERSKMVAISTGMDLLSYSFCILLSSASLYILHHLHKEE